MANYYGSSGGGGGSLTGGGGGGSPSFSPTFTGTKQKPSPSNSQDFADVGKGSIDLGNLVDSIGKTIGNVKDFTTGLVGQVGIPGGPNLGDVAKLPGQAVDALGSVGFGDGANLGALPGVAADVLSAPSNFVQGEAAKSRLRNAQGTGTPLDSLLSNVGSGFNPLSPVSPEMALRQVAEAKRAAGQQLSREEQKILAKSDLPPDIQARLDAGENIDTLANDMVKSGRGFSNDTVQNLASGVVFDPMNLIGAGIGKAGASLAKAGIAVAGGKAAADIGLGERYAGAFYNAASRGLSAGGARLMDNMIGPTTSGVFHALGTRPYNALTSSLKSLAPEYATAYEDAFARGAAQVPRAVIAKYMAEEATQALKAYGKAAATKLTNDIGGSVEARLSAIRRISPAQIERRTEEMLNKTAPDFLGHTDQGRFVETRDKLAAITGMSPEDAGRALGGKASLRTAQHVHLAFYGKAGDALAQAKAAAHFAKNIDAERITLVAPDSLTDELARGVLDGTESIDTAVEKYSVLRNRFGGTQYDHAKVEEFVQKLVNEDALPKTVAAPTTGKNPLPPELQAWKQSYEPFGYKIGFAPKDGWKTIMDPSSGEVAYADPFVHFVSEADPLTMRNPLGRFTDSLMRGASQTTIIHDARTRMVKLTQGTGISPNEGRAVFNRVLEEAAARHVTPRGLSLFGGPHVYEDIFKDVLGPERYATFVEHIDPNYAVMKAFEGNLSRVGLTQKATGTVKTATAGRGNVAAAVTEGIYPTLRFSLSPLFQGQELVESPFFNALRGITPRAMDPELQKVYAELADLPDFKYLTEAGYFLHIAGNTEVARTMGQQSLIGKALKNVPNVKAFKERQRTAQVFMEHGPNFERAVNSINPTLWRKMTEAYGTTDPHAVADAFIKERQALASGNMDEALATFDAAKPQFIQQAYDAGDIAKGQALNKQVGAARGANGAGGAMKLTPEELARLNTPSSTLSKMSVTDEAGAEAYLKSLTDRFGVPAKLEFRDGGHTGIAHAHTLSNEDIISMQRGYFDSDYAARLADYERQYAAHNTHLPGPEGERFHFDGSPAGIIAHEYGHRLQLSIGKDANAVAARARKDLVSGRSVDSSPLGMTNGEAFSEAFVAYARTGMDRWGMGDLLDKHFPAAAVSPAAVPAGAVSHDMETVWQAFRESFRQSSEQAFKTHYFNPTRGFLERSINHPYLGMYPASYMWGKVLPEFARFLLKRPFGLNAPLTGAAAYARVQQTVLAKIATDPEFKKALDQNQDLIYLVDVMLPGSPQNLPANLPAWARHLSQDVASGHKYNPSAELSDTFSYAAGPVRTFNTVSAGAKDLGSIAGDIYASLTQAAQEYDGQFAPPR